MPGRAVAARGASGQASWYRRTAVAPIMSHHGTMFERVARFFFPHTVRNYPGLQRGLLAMVGRPVTWNAVQHWRADRRRLPVDVAEAFRAAALAKIASATSIVAELDAYIAAERKVERRRQGICAVKFDAMGNPVTGQGRGGRPY